MIGRLERSTDFERVLRGSAPAQSAHFAIHHLRDSPSPCGKPRARELSTDLDLSGTTSVDDLPATQSGLTEVSEVPHGIWLGAVVPKRHARRAVTRSLLRRQIHAAVERAGCRLRRGLWVVRLRAPFDRTQFRSAGSGALKHAAQSELQAVLERCIERMGPGAPGEGR
jgi:ribonuclease P protein component